MRIPLRLLEALQALPEASHAVLAVTLTVSALRVQDRLREVFSVQILATQRIRCPIPHLNGLSITRPRFRQYEAMFAIQAFTAGAVIRLVRDHRVPEDCRNFKSTEIPRSASLFRKSVARRIERQRIAIKQSGAACRFCDGLELGLVLGRKLNTNVLNSANL